MPGDDPLLAANGDLRIDEATTVTLSGAGAVLNKGDELALASGLTAGSDVTKDSIDSGRNIFTLRLDNFDLFAVVSGQLSFLEAAKNYLGSGINGNHTNGTGLLDKLNALAATNPNVAAKMPLLDAFFNNTLNTLAPAKGAKALEQFFGSHGAYAKTPLSNTSGSFQKLLGQWNKGFLPDQIALADAGFSSSDAFAAAANDAVCGGRTRVWATGFGGWTHQNASGGFFGYKYDSQGMAIGIDRVLAENCAFGFAAAYSKGDLKINDLFYRNNPDILNLSLHGIWSHASGLYVRGGLGYGHAWNDYTMDMLLGGGRKTGKYGSDIWTANAELGYVRELPNFFTLVPSLGLEYSHLRNRGWTERVFDNPGLVANRFDGSRDNSLGIPVALRANKRFDLSNGGVIVPELRAAWVGYAKQSSPSINAGFDGMPGTATMQGVDPGRSHWRLGAGVSGRVRDRVDFRINYDFDVRRSFRSHNVMAGVGLSF